ncbi:alpha-galactosidase [Paenibacillus lemnae]|uniref:Alpha-galactosidase n=1 Tax=Paenibacillus lemnae TaxID=1330551 RepID=A0A848MFM7_PAELE|nr:alpha-galactosidase [Paenibacillus lemnae]NMO98224.1 hypothetical protein [Paenibacillus lemnae]
MNDFVTVSVMMESGKRAIFERILFGVEYAGENNGVAVSVGDSMPFAVTARPTDSSDCVTSLEFTFYTEIRNYHQAILPDSGRWFFNGSRIVTFWRSLRELETGVDDTKLPLYIFTGKNRFTELAAGVIGENYETSFKLVEPESNRALNVHTGHIAFQIKRGTEQYPIPKRVSQQKEDRAITEYLYYQDRRKDPTPQPWVMTIRDFTDFQRRLYALNDLKVEASMFPVWCTWADWHSNDMTSDMILENVKLGLELGIRNYIIDDGWFGPGLDNDYSVPLNIGDWEPDPEKIPDMTKLVHEIKEQGAVPIIWCAPHAVAAGARCYTEREPLLIADESGSPIINPTQFYSLCFMNKEAREVMADICVRFIEKWDFDGAKYDLFNWVPNVPCCNPNHHHDVSTMLEGLEQTLALIEERTRRLKPDYIVELKQNYGTPSFSRYGTMMRAGDGPYDPESNFLRTLFIQGYTPYALNDYQIIKGFEKPEDTAVAVIKMIAVGIPAYSVDLKKLSTEQLWTIRRYNAWYNENLAMFMNYREPLDAEANLIKLTAPEADEDILFLVNHGSPLEINRNTTVINGTYQPDLFVRNLWDEAGAMQAEVYDCCGSLIETMPVSSGWNVLKMLPGGMVKITIQ